MKGLEDFGYKKPPKQQEKWLAANRKKKRKERAENGRVRKGRKGFDLLKKKGKEQGRQPFYQAARECL